MSKIATLGISNINQILAGTLKNSLIGKSELQKKGIRKFLKGNNKQKSLDGYFCSEKWHQRERPLFYYSKKNAAKAAFFIIEHCFCLFAAHRALLHCLLALN